MSDIFLIIFFRPFASAIPAGEGKTATTADPTGTAPTTPPTLASCPTSASALRGSQTRYSSATTPWLTGIMTMISMTTTTQQQQQQQQLLQQQHQTNNTSRAFTSLIVQDDKNQPIGLLLQFNLEEDYDFQIIQ
jgi:hypothetical protein